MNETFGFLIDMDGVLYRGPELLPGAGEFVRQLREREIPFRFLTNNSQRTRRDVVARLARMGIDVEEQHVFTGHGFEVSNCQPAFSGWPKAIS